MKTLKRKSPKDPPREEQFTLGPEVDPAPAPEGPRFTTVQFRVREDGKIDLESMRESTRVKLRDAVNNTPELRPQVTEAQVQIFHPAMISGMYDLLGSLEALLAQKPLKIPAHIAKQVFTYTEKEKELLAGPTLRVLNKYAADWMIKYQDELALASLLTSITITKCQYAVNAGRMYRATTETPKSQAESEENDEKAEGGIPPPN